MVVRMVGRSVELPSTTLSMWGAGDHWFLDWDGADTGTHVRLDRKAMVALRATITELLEADPDA